MTLSQINFSLTCIKSIIEINHFRLSKYSNKTTEFFEKENEKRLGE